MVKRLRIFDLDKSLNDHLPWSRCHGMNSVHHKIPIINSKLSICPFGDPFWATIPTMWDWMPVDMGGYDHIEMDISSSPNEDPKSLIKMSLINGEEIGDMDLPGLVWGSEQKLILGLFNFKVDLSKLTKMTLFGCGKFEVLISRIIAE